MKKIQVNNISIIGWNACSIYTPSNQFIINNYLDKHKPDFVLLNELGIKGNYKYILHEDYNLIDHMSIYRINI